MAAKKQCTCEVCKALKKGSFTMFQVMYGARDYGDYEILDFYYISLNKTKAQFKAALKAALKKVGESDQLTSANCKDVMHMVLEERGFVRIDDVLTGMEFVDEEFPEPKGCRLVPS